LHVANFIIKSQPTPIPNLFEGTVQENIDLVVNTILYHRRVTMKFITESYGFSAGSVEKFRKNNYRKVPVFETNETIISGMTFWKDLLR
jgi:hypothetical protein